MTTHIEDKIIDSEGITIREEKDLIEAVEGSDGLVHKHEIDFI